MSMLKMEFDDTDSIDAHLDAGIDIIDEKPLIVRDGGDSPTAEYVLSGSEDNIVAYRIVHMPDESSLKQNNNHQHHHHHQQQSIQTATQAINGASVTTAPTQHLQYIVIDGANGFLQAVPANQITASPAAAIKAESITNNSTGTLASILSSSSSSTSVQPISKVRTSIAIAPKVESLYAPSATYTTTVANNTNNKSNTSHIDTLSSFKKRDDRRRATHNEVERRRRDKINHWIMKLGNIIPADGSAIEIGDSGRPSIAAIEGQSKGGILSKACEYVQMLQEKQQTKSAGNASEATNDNQTILEKKKYEDEIARLRGENELLKAILIKNGINYAKERTSFKSNEFS